MNALVIWYFNMMGHTEAKTRLTFFDIIIASGKLLDLSWSGLMQRIFATLILKQIVHSS
jgi:hypothetical protein